MKGAGKGGFKGFFQQKGREYQQKGKGNRKGIGKGWKGKGTAYSWDSFAPYEAAVEQSGANQMGARCGGTPLYNISALGPPPGLTKGFVSKTKLRL